MLVRRKRWEELQRERKLEIELRYKVIWSDLLNNTSQRISARNWCIYRSGYRLSEDFCPCNAICTYTFAHALSHYLISCLEWLEIFQLIIWNHTHIFFKGSICRPFPDKERENLPGKKKKDSLSIIHSDHGANMWLQKANCIHFLLWVLSMLTWGHDSVGHQQHFIRRAFLFITLFFPVILKRKTSFFSRSRQNDPYGILVHMFKAALQHKPTENCPPRWHIKGFCKTWTEQHGL